MRWFVDGDGMLRKNGASLSERNRTPERADEDSCAKGTRYGEKQDVRVLSVEQSGKAVAQVCRAHGMMETTVYQWRTRASAMDEPELPHRNELEDENRRLKALAADLVTEIQVLKKFNRDLRQRVPGADPRQGRD